jgi:flagellar biogenesis protein FliO
MLLLLVQDRARFVRASAMFLSLPLLLLLVLLLFWVLDKQKHST